MITQHDLQEAISECLGQRNPNASTCIKLAAFYTIKNELFGNPERLEAADNTPASYSFAPPPVNEVETIIDYDSDTEFSRAIKGKKASYVLPVIDELMETISALNPRLYAGVLKKLR